MKIKELIARDRRSLSFEFFPPGNKEGEKQLFEAIGKLESLKPAFVSVTYGAGGGTQKNTRHVLQRIKEETSLTVVPHLTCVNQSEKELRDILHDYRELGVENILALRGDLPGDAMRFSPRDGLCHARDLVQLAAAFNSFSIGVAVYPEGHIESPNLEMDMVYTKEKIDAGADFAITQMFFENSYFYDFMERAGRVGIHIPIIAGIMPITDIEKIKRFSQMCGATLPASLAHTMENAASPEEARKLGIDFAIRQYEDLREHGVRYFHFYSMNRAETVIDILCNVSLDKRSVLCPAL